MNLSVYLRKGFVHFGLDPEVGAPEDPESPDEKYVRRLKEGVMSRLVDLLDATGKVSNSNKLLSDLWNREKKASTAVGDGLAIPHVRTMQVRELIMGFARAAYPLPYDAPDGRPVENFIVVVGPSYDDKTYLKIYKSIAEIFRFDSVRARLREASGEGEIYRIFDGQF
jgi:mannitol/fructose-specific phosphotransferase system IIA component (Ntr-type)